MMTDIETSLASLFAAHPEVRLGFIFGSIARGTAGKDSDIDVAVAGPRPLTQEEKQMLIREIAELSGRAVDVVDLQTAGAPIRRTVLRGGKLIHCMDRSLYAEIIKRTVFDAADLMPYRERILTERRRKWIGR